MDSWLGRLGVRFLKSVTSHLFCHFVPFTLWTIFTDRIPLFSLNQDREMTFVLLQIFLQIEKRVEHLTRILSCCLLIPVRCRWTSTWRWSFVWNFLVFHLISTVTPEPSWLSCNRIESWENIPLEFHWIAVNSVQVSVFLRWFEPIPIFLPMHRSIGSSRVLLPRHNTEFEKT